MVIALVACAVLSARPALAHPPVRGTIQLANPGQFEIGLGLLLLGLVASWLYERRARRQAELRTHEQLVISAHLERQYSMGELAAALTHELSQPLGAIRFNVQAADRMLESNHVSTGELREILADITREDARASQIIQRQRAMLQKREFALRPLDLNEVVGEALAFIAHEAQTRGVRIEMQRCGDGCAVSGDRILLQQVVINLAVNAMDAMAQTPVSQRCVLVRTQATAGGVEVSVQDRGEGIAPDVAARLFEPFVTTKPNGMGIGLAVVRGIVEAHGGSIHASNGATGGATFLMALPARAVSPASELQASA
jgi:C4-dicarboxylate-specific signal transduction histidine kinase